MARFAVIGLGRFGSTLASRLYELGHEVLGVDSDEELVQAFRDRMSEVAVADARDKGQIRALGLKDFDTVIISVGEHLEASTLASLYCRELGVRVIARAVNEDHGKILEALGVDEVIYPERDMALRLAERLSSKNLLDFVSLGPEFSILEVAAPASFIGKSLAELEIRRRFGVHVIAIRDVLTENVTPAPPPDAKIRDSDVLVVLGGREELERFQRVK
ncbi:MAG: TrkA family potassium uptake protein [Thermoanaerobaculum sp.]|nr:TrkA family potassium uptake protein [Thermoanaerobaculum sp.]MDW7966644.1 TrkA family potassium uptake protein [Thermoanaerobaculum sp.]